MTPAQGALAFMCAALVSTVLLDCVLLIWRALVPQTGRNPLQRLVTGMSQGVGRVLLAACLPGAVIALVAIYFRSWDDGSLLKMLLGLFSLGAVLGMYMVTDLGTSTMSTSRGDVALKRHSRTSFKHSSSG